MAHHQHVGSISAKAAPSAAAITWNDGAADGDWSDANNWTGGVPTTSDTAFLASSSRDIDAGMSQGAVFLDALRIGAGYTGDLGTLTIDAREVSIRKIVGTVALSGMFRDVFIMDTSDDAAAVTFDGSSQIERLYVYAGNVQIADGAELGEVWVVPYAGRRCKVTIGSSVTGWRGGASTTSVYVGGRGVCVTSSTATTYDVAGGRVEADAAVSGTIDVYGGGVVDSVADLGTVSVYADSALTIQNATGEITITSLTTNPGSTAVLHTGTTPATVTTLTYHGGRLRFEEGTTVTP